MPINDPQWGKKGNDGPPDLDEILRKFNQKLAGLFGGKGGGNAGGPAPNMRQWGGGIGIVIVLALLIWVLSGFYIVNEGTRGVLLRFGRYVESTMPGPRWHLPYPIETAEVVNISSVRTVEIGYRGSVRQKVAQESLMLTDDENIIDLQFAVQYTLKDPVAFLFNNAGFSASGNSRDDEAVRQVAETAIREIVGKSRMDYVLYEGRSEIAANAQKLMQLMLDRYATGIAVSKVTMQNAQPPEQVQAAFDDAVKAGQDRERAKNEGQAYANDVIPRARGMASRLLEEAQGYKGRVVAQAEGDANRFKQILTEYEKAPVVTRERMYLDMMQQVLSSVSKIVTDSKGSGNLLYLPLDKLVQMGAQPGTAPPAAAADARPAPVPEPLPQPSTDTSGRTRDNLRSRDRETR
jgi:membrane protease subunit HflK